MGSSSVVHSDSSFSTHGYVQTDNPKDIKAASAETGGGADPDAMYQVGLIINHAMKGTGSFKDVEGFQNGLKPDEQAMLAQAADLRSQGHDEAATLYELKVAQSIDNRYREEMGSADEHEGLRTVEPKPKDAKSFSLVLANQIGPAKLAFFEAMPGMLDSMSGEEFVLFMAEFASVMGPSIESSDAEPHQEFGFLNAEQHQELKSLIQSYDFNSAQGLQDQRSHDILSIADLIKKALPGAVPAAGADSSTGFSVQGQATAAMETAFDGVVFSNNRVAKIWVKEQLVSILNNGGGQLNEDVSIEVQMAEYAQLDTKVRDLYTLWQTAFQMAAN